MSEGSVQQIVNFTSLLSFLQAVPNPCSSVSSVVKLLFPGRADAGFTEESAGSNTLNIAVSGARSTKILLLMRLLCFFAAIPLFQSLAHATGCPSNWPCFRFGKRA